MTTPWRRLPVGAEIASDGGVHFRVWAPHSRIVRVVLDAGGNGNGTNGTGSHTLADEGNGYFSRTVEAAGPGTCYWYKLDDDASLYPDPASRFQPGGPFGPSEVIDPAAFAWTDDGWAGIGSVSEIFDAEPPFAANGCIAQAWSVAEVLRA